MLGENVFKANIELCMNRLHAQMQERKYPETLKGLRIAADMDEFAYEGFNHECIMLRINPQNVDEQLAIFQPHILFTESAWHGNKGTWERKISNPSQELKSATMSEKYAF